MVTNGSPSIYTVRIALDDTKPPVWRTFQVRGDITLAGLCDVAVAVMGWSGYHMHLWRVGRKQYGVIHDDDFMNPGSVLDESDVRLCDAVPKKKGKLRLVYDMGDGWEHTLQVEEIGAPEPGVSYPVCIGGAMACPPEDCGGPWGFYDKLEILRDPSHEDYNDIKEWMGEYEPTAFDLSEVNKALRQGGAPRNISRGSNSGKRETICRRSDSSDSSGGSPPIPTASIKCYPYPRGKPYRRRAAGKGPRWPRVSRARTLYHWHDRQRRTGRKKIQQVELQRVKYWKDRIMRPEFGHLAQRCRTLLQNFQQFGQTAVSAPKSYRFNSAKSMIIISPVTVEDAFPE